MLEIAQAGQAGKTKLLLDMHRLRKRVFKDRLNWKVTVTKGGLEVDEYDIPEAVYLLALNDDERVIGNWRLLPTSGPTMIREIWPKFLETLPMSSSPQVWEASRFAVEATSQDAAESLAQVNRATQELFCGLAELSLLCGIQEIFTLYDMRIARLLRRLDCRPRAVSARMKIDNQQTEIGAFTMDDAMLSRLRKATSIDYQLISQDMLPPILQEYRSKKSSDPKKEPKTGLLIPDMQMNERMLVA